ncbi:AGAP000520-PA-like protein [Anopheles sinensis]|uniref:AGAP000520-PA-like protein n=1 Tax=Anopheles sinensis TaxID=74873 RepID=A0A084WGQ2_ANOSI|nr:AGAP000520-PA-like protein [Anopheles sinensis]
MAVIFRHWYAALLVCLLVGAALVSEVDAFRLKEDRPGLAIVKRNLSPRLKKGFDGESGLIGGRKRWSVREEDEEEEEDEAVDEDDDDEEEDEDDEEGERESEAIRKATQQRLQRARRSKIVSGKAKPSKAPSKPAQKSVTSEKGKSKKQSVASDDKKDETQQAIESWLAGLGNVFRTIANRDNEDEGFLGWLGKLTAKDEDKPTAKNDADDGDDEKEKENPLINLLTSWLHTLDTGTDGDSNEEIRIRPVGDRREDASDEVDAKTSKGSRKPKQESKLVQLLNESPIAALFSAEELPKEASIETGPKKAKKVPQGPSKVVKQRIAISPEDFEQLLLRVPSFVPDYSLVPNEECRRQGHIFERQLRGKRLWALQMMDASAKLTSGLLRGNANQLGDFDLCTGIATKIQVKQNEQVRMRGKYCLAHVDVVAEDEELRLPVHLLQGRGFIKSTLNDPDHFLPRFTTINWGICLPAACTFEDAANIVKHFVRPYNSTGIKLFLELEEGNCHVRQVRTWSRLLKDNWQLVAVLGFYTFVVVVTLVATMNDYGIFIKIEPPSKLGASESEATSPDQLPTNVFHQTLMAFSLKKTLHQLIGSDTAFSEDGQDPAPARKDIRCLHGLKAVASIALFLALRLVPLGFQPFTNRNEFTESFSAPWSITVRLLMLYADVFLVISGFLAAYHMVREYRERAKVAWFKRIVGRYLRLTFPLIPVLVFYAWIWEHLGSGPQWGDVVVKNANLCKHNYLSNLFFIQNWYPVEEACAPHTVQLAIEMQLSVLAPFLMIVLVKNPFYGTAAYVILNGISTAIRFSSTTEDRLTPYVFNGVRLTQLYRTINLSFAETLHRLTPYLAGFGLGYLLQETGRQRQERGVHYAGWIGAAISLLWCVYFPLDIVRKDFQYDPGNAAQFAALAPLSFALGVCWLIYFCVTVEDSLLNRFLSSRPMVFLGNLSYSLSLVQFLVFFYFAGSTRGSEVFSFTSYVNRAEVCMLFGASLLLTVLFDLPIQNVKRLLDREGVLERMETNEPAKAEEQSEVQEPSEESTEQDKGAEKEASGESNDFVSPFDDRDEEDDGIWIRKSKVNPPVEDPVEDFWAQRDEDTVKAAPEPTKPNVKRRPESNGREWTRSWDLLDD